jgi:hypothetical protein
MACQGIWDNFQCRHHETPLSTAKACEDVGKIIFHAYRKVFLPPRRCIFVTPRGPATALRDMLLNPERLRAEVLQTWNVRVAGRVAAGEKHKLEGELAIFAQNYDYSSFGYATLDEILDAHRKTAYWASRFGGLLPPPPPGRTPKAIASRQKI